MAAPTLQVEEYQYDEDGVGILLNGGATLPFVDVTSVDGLDQAPIRVTQRDREGMDGGYVDAQFEGLRTVTLEGVVYADPSDLESYLDDLKANFAPRAATRNLYFKTDHPTHGDRMVIGKSLGFRYPKQSLRRLGAVEFQVQISCQDSRIYSVAPVNTSFTRSVGSGGVVLSGNRDSNAILTVSGTISNPTITHTQSGTTMTFAGSLTSTDDLVIDLEARSVILNGNTNWRSKMTFTAGGWYLLEPGSNDFALGGVGGTATLTVDTRHAWR